MLSSVPTEVFEQLIAVMPKVRETAGEAIENTANDVADVLWDGKPDPLDNEEDNQFNSLIGEILIGFGLVCF